MENIQIIRKPDGTPEYAVVPWKEFTRMAPDRAEAEMTDEELFDLAMQDDSEAFPLDVVKQLLEGENPVRVFRKYRGLKQEELADATGITSAYVSQIERGERTGTIETMKKIAKALSVDLDDLIAEEESDA